MYGIRISVKSGYSTLLHTVTVQLWSSAMVTKYLAPYCVQINKHTFCPRRGRNDQVVEQLIALSYAQPDEFSQGSREFLQHYARHTAPVHATVYSMGA